MKSYFITSNSIEKGPSSGINVVKGDADFLYDHSKKYLDLRSGLWNVSLGYNNTLLKKIKEEFGLILDNGIPYLDINSYHHDYYDEYSKRILKFMDEDDVFVSASFTTGGSEGVEMSVKISHDFANSVGKNNKKIIIFKNSYHGTFFGSMSVSHKFFGLKHSYETVNDVIIVEPPKNEEDLKNISSIIYDNRDDIASFIIEPVLGSAGSINIKEEYLDRIIGLCKECDILTIFDEVSTGFYRTGERFAFTNLHQKPNIVILSKSINNGIVPFGVIVVDKYTYRHLQNQNINHFSTQSGNLLGVTSALVTLDFFQQNENIIKENVKLINSTMLELSQLNSVFVNGRGAMFSVPVENVSKAVRIRDSLKQMGILVYIYHNTDDSSGITIYPNLLMNPKELEKSLKIIFRKMRD